jgi:hypothetical protein
MRGECYCSDINVTNPSYCVAKEGMKDGYVNGKRMTSVCVDEGTTASACNAIGGPDEQDTTKCDMVAHVLTPGSCSDAAYTTKDTCKASVTCGTNSDEQCVWTAAVTGTPTCEAKGGQTTHTCAISSFDGASTCVARSKERACTFTAGDSACYSTYTCGDWNKAAKQGLYAGPPVKTGLNGCGTGRNYNELMKDSPMGKTPQSTCCTAPPTPTPLPWYDPDLDPTTWVGIVLAVLLVGGGGTYAYNKHKQRAGGAAPARVPVALPAQ